MASGFYPVSTLFHMRLDGDLETGVANLLSLLAPEGLE